MANLKSSKKRIQVSAREKEENIPVKSRARTAIKDFEKAAAAGEKKLDDKIKKAYKAIDKATNLGIIHKNKAARTKSRLTKIKNKAE